MFVPPGSFPSSVGVQLLLRPVRFFPRPVRSFFFWVAGGLISHVVVEIISVGLCATDVFRRHLLLSFSRPFLLLSVGPWQNPLVGKSLTPPTPFPNAVIWQNGRKGCDWLQAVWRFMPLVSSLFRSTGRPKFNVHFQPLGRFVPPQT